MLPTRCPEKSLIRIIWLYPFIIVKSCKKKMKILCVLYDDPKGGMPKSYPLSNLPKLDKYPGTYLVLVN